MKFNPKDKVKIVALGPWHDTEGYVKDYVGQVTNKIGRYVIGDTLSSYRVELKNGSVFTFTESELVRV